MVEASNDNGTTVEDEKRKVQNIVIDIESEELTYNQARSIRLQIQRDVEQLRNRVRMLQAEEQRARKKIEETRKKTRNIMDLQEKNDRAYQNKMMRQRQEQQQQVQARKEAVERRMKQNKDVRVRTNEVVQQKMATVYEVRQQKQNAKKVLAEVRNEYKMTNAERRNQIREQKNMGVARQNEFIRKKVYDARQDVDGKASNLKSEINKFETEAQQLERLEADLLQKLQETQKNERIAFGKLENAMVEASIPTSLRKGGAVNSKNSLPLASSASNARSSAGSGRGARAKSKN